MHVYCPQCRSAVEIVQEPEGKPATCPACGSHLTLLDETLSYEPTKLRSLGKCQLLEHVGSGHFGDVWKARDLELDRLVAVKIPRAAELDSSAQERLLREARAAAQLRHPNIVTVHEVGIAEGVIYIVSDFIQGVTLAELIADQRPAHRQAVELCIKLARALEHAHQSGVIHRDLKPGNILVDSAGEPYLADFGLAKRDGGEMTMTVEGQVLGTPAYMPPEQARGDAHSADQRSDVYSLGVTLYELLTGRRPFGGGKRMLLHQVLSDEAPPLRKFDKHIPRDLETICLKAVAKEPSQRYQTAREMAEDLQRFLDGKPIQARPVSRLTRAWRWARRNPVLAATAGTAIVLALLLAGALAWPQPPEIPLRSVSLATDPPGANVVFIPLAPADGTPRPKRKKVAQGTSPVEVELAPGDYLVVAYFEDGRFHEVFRHVPDFDEAMPEVGPYLHRTWTERDGRTELELPTIEIPDASVTDQMASVPGSKDFVMGSEELGAMAPEHHRSVPPFYLDPTEVTFGQFRKAWPGWRTVAPKCLAPLSHEDDQPVACVSWDEAVAVAENLGKRLPDEAEYEYAATSGGKRKFPWGDRAEQLSEWTFGAVGSQPLDRVEFLPGEPIFGLYSNVAEWTVSWYTAYPGRRKQVAPNNRVFRGGTNAVIHRRPEPGDWQDGPCFRASLPRQMWLPGLGFRCARSQKPRLAEEDFVRITSSPAGPTPRAP